MKNIPWVAKIAFVLAIILTVPYAVTAQQKALSVSSLQTSFGTETRLLQQKIYNAQAEYKVLNCATSQDERSTLTNVQQMQCYEDNLTISKANDDMHTLQLAYQLVLDSLK